MPSPSWTRPWAAPRSPATAELLRLNSPPRASIRSGYAEPVSALFFANSMTNTAASCGRRKSRRNDAAIAPGHDRRIGGRCRASPLPPIVPAWRTGANRREAAAPWLETLRRRPDRGTTRRRPARSAAAAYDPYRKFYPGVAGTIDHAPTMRGKNVTRSFTVASCLNRSANVSIATSSIAAKPTRSTNGNKLRRTCVT